jgi:F0F1-type ATP synthase assembly protein I
MAFNPPNPDANSRSASAPGKRGGVTRSLVQAEQLIQIAMVLPSALLIGWGAGWLVDHWLHTHWGVVAGLLLGIVAGMVSAIRMAMVAMNSLSGQGRK